MSGLKAKGLANESGCMLLPFFVTDVCASGSLCFDFDEHACRKIVQGCTRLYMLPEFIWCLYDVYRMFIWCLYLYDVYMMFICSILSNLISIHSAGCQTPLLVLCPGSVKVMSTMVDTVVQNQVETIEVVKPTVVLWQRHWHILTVFRS